MAHQSDKGINAGTTQSNHDSSRRNFGDNDYFRKVSDASVIFNGGTKKSGEHDINQEKERRRNK